MRAVVGAGQVLNTSNTHTNTDNSSINRNKKIGSGAVHTHTYIHMYRNLSVHACMLHVCMLWGPPSKRRGHTRQKHGGSNHAHGAHTRAWVRMSNAAASADCWLHGCWGAGLRRLYVRAAGYCLPIPPLQCRVHGSNKAVAALRLRSLAIKTGGI